MTQEQKACFNWHPHHSFTRSSEVTIIQKGRGPEDWDILNSYKGKGEVSFSLFGKNDCIKGDVRFMGKPPGALDYMWLGLECPGVNLYEIWYNPKTRTGIIYPISIHTPKNQNPHLNYGEIDSFRIWPRLPDEFIRFVINHIDKNKEADEFTKKCLIFLILKSDNCSRRVALNFATSLPDESKKICSQLIDTACKLTAHHGKTKLNNFLRQFTTDLHFEPSVSDRIINGRQVHESIYLTPYIGGWSKVDEDFVITNLDQIFSVDYSRYLD